MTFAGSIPHDAPNWPRSFRALRQLSTSKIQSRISDICEVIETKVSPCNHPGSGAQVPNAPPRSMRGTPQEFCVAQNREIALGRCLAELVLRMKVNWV